VKRQAVFGGVRFRRALCPRMVIAVRASPSAYVPIRPYPHRFIT